MVAGSGRPIAGRRSGGRAHGVDQIFQVRHLRVQLAHARVHVEHGFTHGAEILRHLIQLLADVGNRAVQALLLLLHGVVEAVLHDRHGGIGAVDAVQRLLRECLDGGHLLIQRALQITHLVLQQRDVALQFHNLFARAECERDSAKNTIAIRDKLIATPVCRGAAFTPAPRILNSAYWPGDKCARRFFCQQSSVASVHCGRSLP